MAKRGGEKYSVAISPIDSPMNPFVKNFSNCFRDRGFDVILYDWSWSDCGQAEAIILHWPDMFFSARTLRQSAKALWILAKLMVARARGARLVWVAHNAKPHESGAGRWLVQRLFFWNLDGIIFLSEASKDLVCGLYSPLRRTRLAVTVHGHYRDDAVTPPTPLRQPGQPIRAISFGQIRPYKNLEKLAAVTGRETPDEVHLTILGRVIDRALAGRLAASAAPHIRLDLRDGVIPDKDLEAAIDASDAVILPFADIMNSATALMALSRNRPILTPALGSLPELRENVGHDWVYLYKGEFDGAVLRRFIGELRNRRGSAVCDLSKYDWGPIADTLSTFIRDLIDHPHSTGRQPQKI